MKILKLSVLLCLLSSVIFTQEKKNVELKVPDIKANTWVDAKLNYIIPEKYHSKNWSTTDGFCDSLYRSKTGSILIRTGIISKKLGIYPGYYSNTQMEWNLATNKVEVIDVFNWGGGSGGKGKLLPGFKENPSPGPRHTYDGMAYDSDEDAMYLMLGAYYKTGGVKAEEEAKKQLALDAKSTWKFTFKDRKWHRIEGNVNQLWKGLSPFELHLEYWPSAKKILYLGGNGKSYAEFDTKTQKWTKVKLKNRLPVGTFGARSTWDSKREHWVFRLGSSVGYIDPKTKSCSSLPKLPDKFSVVKEGRKSWHRYKSIAYISKHDVFIVTGETGNDTYVYDHKTKKWEQVLGDELKLPNGYIEYDVKTDLIGLVSNKVAYKFRYVPVIKNVRNE